MKYNKKTSLYQTSLTEKKHWWVVKLVRVNIIIIVIISSSSSLTPLSLPIIVFPLLFCGVAKIGHNMETPPKKSTLFSILSSVFDSCFPPPAYHDQSHKTEPGPTPVIAVIMYRRPSDYISQLYSDYIRLY